MTTLEPEQKDILEKLNEIALEANWGGVDRVYTAEVPNGVPKAIAVIKEAMEEIKRLRELPKEILQALQPFTAFTKEEYKGIAKKFGVTLDEANS